MNIYLLEKMLYRKKLRDDFDTSSQYLEIINDYMIRTSDVSAVLKRASELKKQNPGFDYYSYIIYGLISSGKNANL